MESDELESIAQQHPLLLSSFNGMIAAKSAWIENRRLTCVRFRKIAHKSNKSVRNRNDYVSERDFPAFLSLDWICCWFFLLLFYFAICYLFQFKYAQFLDAMMTRNGLISAPNRYRKRSKHWFDPYILIACLECIHFLRIHIYVSLCRSLA